MRRYAGLAVIILLQGPGAPALAQTPVDGRIVRVVYKVSFQGGGPKNVTWGLHLAHMSDGHYCVRFGDPGRLALANIRRTNDICFPSLPGKTDRASERIISLPDAGHPVPVRSVIVFQKGTIELAGIDVTLNVENCAKVEGEQEARCFSNRYVVHMNGDTCSAEITFSSPLTRAADPTCEHYKAE